MTIGDIASLDRFQVHPNGKSRTIQGRKNHHALDAGGAQRVIITTLRAWIGSKLNANGKYRVRNIYFENISIGKSHKEVILLNSYYQPERKPVPKSKAPMVIENISFKNINCESAKYAYRLVGLPEEKAKNITIDGLKVSKVEREAEVKDVDNLVLLEIETE